MGSRIKSEIINTDSVLCTASDQTFLVLGSPIGKGLVAKNIRNKNNVASYRKQRGLQIIPTWNRILLQIFVPSHFQIRESCIWLMALLSPEQHVLFRKHAQTLQSPVSLSTGVE